MSTPAQRPHWRVRFAGPGITRGAAYATVFLFALSFALAAGSYWLAVSAVNHAAANTATLAQLCQTGNEFRTENVVLWEHIITVAQPPPSETPAQHQARLDALRAFERYIHKVFALRDCAHPGAPPSPRPSAPPSS